MNRKNPKALAERVSKAAEAALAAQGYVSPIDVLVGIGWLDAPTVERWRRGQIDCLERAVQTSLPRISEAMKLLRSWASERNLSASPTHYVARTPQRQTLRFSRSRRRYERQGLLVEPLALADVQRELEQRRCE